MSRCFALLGGALLIALGALSSALADAPRMLGNGNTESCETRNAMDICISEVTYTFQDGTRIVGHYQPGSSRRMTGRSVTYFPSGTVETCENTEGFLCNGAATIVFPSGTTRVGTKIADKGKERWTGPVETRYGNGGHTRCADSTASGNCLGGSIYEDGFGLRIQGRHASKDKGTELSGAFTEQSPGNASFYCDVAAGVQWDCGPGLMVLRWADGTEWIGRGTRMRGDIDWSGGVLRIAPDGTRTVCRKARGETCTGTILREQPDGRFSP